MKMMLWRLIYAVLVFALVVRAPATCAGHTGTAEPDGRECVSLDQACVWSPRTAVHCVGTGGKDALLRRRPGLGEAESIVTSGARREVVDLHNPNAGCKPVVHRPDALAGWIGASGVRAPGLEDVELDDVAEDEACVGRERRVERAERDLLSPVVPVARRHTC